MSLAVPPGYAAGRGGQAGAAGGSAGACRPLDVLLLRNMPSDRNVSMERLAGHMEAGFAQRADFHVHSLTVSEWGFSQDTLARWDYGLTRFLRLPLTARRLQPDLYHIIDHTYAGAVRLLPPQRTVISCHDLIPIAASYGRPGYPSLRITEPDVLRRFIWSVSYLRRAAAVICPSESTKTDVAVLCGVTPGRIAVVPYGVDPAFRWLGAEAAANLKRTLPGAAAHTVLHVSTGGRYKNPLEPVRVVAALRRTGLDVSLVRVGAPLRRRERNEARRLGMEETILECGHVSNERLVEIYNACDVLLFPSFYEGYGWPPLEAMACGTPVVASDCGSLREVIGNAGFTLPPSDTAALASAVRAVIGLPGLAQSLRERGMARAAQCPWERTVAGFAAVYGRVAARLVRRT